MCLGLDFVCGRSKFMVCLCYPNLHKPCGRAVSCIQRFHIHEQTGDVGPGENYLLASFQQNCGRYHCTVGTHNPVDVSNMYLYSRYCYKFY